MSSYASDDLYIPVMPRILDPSLKFNQDSMLSGLEKSKNNLRNSKSNTPIISNDNQSSDKIMVKSIATPGDESSSFSSKKESIITVVSKYKTVIIVLIVIILLAIVIYFVYKKFYKNKDTPQYENVIGGDTSPSGKESSVKERPEENTTPGPPVSTNIQEMENYLSKYITEDSEASESGDSVAVEVTEKANLHIDNINDIIPEKIPDWSSKGLPDIAEVDEYESESEAGSDNVVGSKNEPGPERIEEIADDESLNDDVYSFDYAEEDLIENDILKEEESFEDISKSVIKESESKDETINLFNKYK